MIPYNRRNNYPDDLRSFINADFAKSIMLSKTAFQAAFARITLPQIRIREPHKRIAVTAYFE